MDLGLDTGLRNLPIVVKRMQRRQWGRIVPAFWDGEELSGWGSRTCAWQLPGFAGELSSAPGRLTAPRARRAAIHESVCGFAWTSGRQRCDS
jgi:hypothetical protein